MGTTRQKKLFPSGACNGACKNDCLLCEAWLNYQLFLVRLARLAADKAREDKSSVITRTHVHAAAYSILGKSRG